MTAAATPKAAHNLGVGERQRGGWLVPPGRVPSAASAPSVSLSQKRQVTPVVWCPLAGELAGLSPSDLPIAFGADCDKGGNSKIEAPFKVRGDTFFWFVLKKRVFSPLTGCFFFFFASLSSLR